MHIPDGYISPATAAALYVAATPFWVRASQKVKQHLTGRFVPLIALFSAFSFVIMMFNVPLPGGTTGHAVGATLAGIVLGPWPAVLAVSVALIIQAIFFGDGGILAIGANVVIMAVAMPFVGSFIYRAIAGGSDVTSRRRAVAAGIAGYVAINVAALLTGVILGVQPLLYRDAGGNALYFPYGLGVAIPAMLLGHLTVGGLVEGLVTGLVVGWLGRAHPQLLARGEGEERPAGRAVRWGWIALAALAVLTPLGLLAPGTAWGEWGRDELAELGLGYIPAGFDRWSSLWSAPLPDYEASFLSNPTVAYILSAVIGAGLAVLAVLLLAWVVRLVAGRQRADA